jgi:hypothetical protein
MLKFVTASIVISVLIGTSAFADNARSYCAKVKNDDKIRKIEPEILPFARKEYPGNEDRNLRESTVYRCMGGKVWICNYGANIPCDGVDRSKGSPAIDQWCRENPNEDYIPMAVTGHATMYQWKCARGKPVKSPRKLDAQGFQGDIWVRVP